MSSTTCHICSGSRAKLFMQKDGSDYYRCPDCKLEFIFPQPDDIALEKIYSENYYNSWGLHVDSSKGEKSKRLTFEYRVKLIEHELKQDDSILDCGCATGFFLDLLKEKGFVPYGVEISLFAANVCRRKFGKQNIFLGNFENAEFGSVRENMFSAIFMTDYLEHVRNPREVLVTAFRFLRPGGLLVITTPDTSSLSYTAMGGSWIHYKSEHLYYFSKRNIELLLTQAGFLYSNHSKGWKYFSMDYVHRQFNAYPVPVLSPLVRVLFGILPAGLRQKTFSVHAGEMIVIAKKPTSEK
ncbi:MAG TPA: class I SAM-dependent methyltransferase [Bacteroidia bacterium]|nr:class I SAM-dependent methyltransferase [Bacteroidia bacterium]